MRTGYNKQYRKQPQPDLAPPDLAPSDFFLLLYIKKSLKGRRFHDIEDADKPLKTCEGHIMDHFNFKDF